MGVLGFQYFQCQVIHVGRACDIHVYITICRDFARLGHDGWLILLICAYNLVFSAQFVRNLSRRKSTLLCPLIGMLLDPWRVFNCYFGELNLCVFVAIIVTPFWFAFIVHRCDSSTFINHKVFNYATIVLNYKTRQFMLLLRFDKYFACISFTDKEYLVSFITELSNFTLWLD